MSVQRILAIFEKDIKDFPKNMALLMLPVSNALLALIYSLTFDGELPIKLLYVIIGATLSMVTSGIMMSMIAEENEKNTMRGLIQSPASLLDIIIGKSLVTGIITVISLMISLMIVGIEPFLNFRAIIGLILLFLFFLLLGIGIGLFSKSLAATSGYLMPVMFLFGFTPMIATFQFAEDSMIVRVTNTFPIMQAIELYQKSFWLPLCIIAIWIIGAALFTYVCFRKVMTDD
ncbi:MAG: ABC transporter permease [Bacillota bacterium]|uniref:ABC transporter permease n=1 Tax=Fictibacillus phosphorivorans TaxID=1221500 RepID=UPI0011A7732E|nr:ABC transporter permease [Fictibacillus phosphorivorans]